MQWTPGGDGSDIEDRRDESGGGFGFGGFGGMHLGIGGLIVVGLLSLIFHQNFFALFSGGGSAPTVRSAPNPALDRAEQPVVEFVKFVVNDVQHTWDQTLERQTGRPYRHAKLVLYRRAYPSACGMAQSAIGPFYCPADEKVYLDLSFFQELRDRFGAPGDFAEAYVIAHEFGHHVQKILGIEAKIRTLQQADPGETKHYSVALELQADCFAGVWGHSTQQRGLIDQADVREGLNAAAAVGDDRLQREATGHVAPESFTHGSSAQRVAWFDRGLEAGRISACNTLHR
jgi:predicted metalloprotease